MEILHPRITTELGLTETSVLHCSLQKPPSCLPGIHCAATAGLDFVYVVEEPGADSVFCGANNNSC